MPRRTPGVILADCVNFPYCKDSHLEPRIDNQQGRAITGHKTDKMAARYVQISAEMVARMMNNESLPAELAPAKVYSVAADVRPLPANVVSIAQYQRSA